MIDVTRCECSTLKGERCKRRAVWGYNFKFTKTLIKLCTHHRNIVFNKEKEPTVREAMLLKKKGIISKVLNVLTDKDLTFLLE